MRKSSKNSENKAILTVKQQSRHQITNTSFKYNQSIDTLRKLSKHINQSYTVIP